MASNRMSLPVARNRALSEVLLQPFPTKDNNAGPSPSSSVAGTPLAALSGGNNRSPRTFSKTSPVHDPFATMEPEQILGEEGDEQYQRIKAKIQVPLRPAPPKVSEAVRQHKERRLSRRISEAVTGLASSRSPNRSPLAPSLRNSVDRGRSPNAFSLDGGAVAHPARVLRTRSFANGTTTATNTGVEDSPEANPLPSPTLSEEATALLQEYLYALTPGLVPLPQEESMDIDEMEDELERLHAGGSLDSASRNPTYKNGKSPLQKYLVAPPKTAVPQQTRQQQTNNAPEKPFDPSSNPQAKKLSDRERAGRTSPNGGRSSRRTSTSSNHEDLIRPEHVSEEVEKLLEMPMPWTQHVVGRHRTYWSSSRRHMLIRGRSHSEIGCQSAIGTRDYVAATRSVLALINLEEHQTRLDLWNQERSRFAIIAEEFVQGANYWSAFQSPVTLLSVMEFNRRQDIMSQELKEMDYIFQQFGACVLLRWARRDRDEAKSKYRDAKNHLELIKENDRLTDVMLAKTNSSQNNSFAGSAALGSVGSGAFSAADAASTSGEHLDCSADEHGGGRGRRRRGSSIFLNQNAATNNGIMVPRKRSPSLKSPPLSPHQHQVPLQSMTPPSVEKE